MKFILILALFLAVSFVQLTKVLFTWSGYVDLEANFLFLVVTLIALIFVGANAVKR